MSETEEEKLRYPIGRFQWRGPAAAGARDASILDVESLPADVARAVGGLTEAQWKSTYRPGGWTAHQLVHHIPESHLNAFVRFKLALTEKNPTIRPYDEEAWARAIDIEATHPSLSLALLSAIHARWMPLLRSMREEDFARTLFHPEHGKTFTLDYMLAQYAWHGRHHLAHIRAAVG